MDPSLDSNRSSLFVPWGSNSVQSQPLGWGSKAIGRSEPRLGPSALSKRWGPTSIFVIITAARSCHLVPGCLGFEASLLFLLRLDYSFASEARAGPEVRKP